MAITAEQVKLIYPSTGSADLSGYIAAANAVANAQLLDKELDSDLLEQITIYLAAHFAVLGIERGGQRRKRIGEADESYKTPGDKDLGFASTRFGQTAMIMDSSGTLAGMAANNKLPALFDVIGNFNDGYSG